MRMLLVLLTAASLLQAVPVDLGKASESVDQDKAVESVDKEKLMNAVSF